MMWWLASFLSVLRGMGCNVVSWLVWAFRVGSFPGCSKVDEFYTRRFGKGRLL